MDSDRTDGEASDPQRWTPRHTLIIGAAFAAPIAILVFAGSLIAVPLIYLAVCVEGIAIAFVVVTRVRLAEGTVEGNPGVHVTDRADLGVDRVLQIEPIWASIGALSAKVEWAAKGSDMSRREIARIIARSLRQYHATPSGGAAPLDRNFSDAIENVVYPYRDDPLVKAETGALTEAEIDGRKTTASGKEGAAHKSVRAASEKGKTPGRGQYLASLEEIVAKLELGMNQPGSQ